MCETQACCEQTVQTLAQLQEENLQYTAEDNPQETAGLLWTVICGVTVSLLPHFHALWPWTNGENPKK